MQGNVKPLGDRVLVERLDGDGREQVSKGGIILPAHDATLRRGNSKRVPDTFRARVLAVSDEAARLSQGELAPGVEVIVHTYDNNDADRTLAGEDTRFGMIVRVDDVIGVVESDEVAAFWAQTPCARAACSMPSGHHGGCDDAAREVRLPQAIESLGFHRRGGF